MMVSNKRYWLILMSGFHGLTIGINSPVEQTFTHIYTNGYWWTGETHSGCGSNLYQTQLIRKEIPRIIEQFNITSLLDAPCGDFHWMKEVSLSIPYIGADIRNG